MSNMPDNIYVVPEDPSSICSTGLMPHILTGIFLQLIRHHFSEAGNIVQQALRKYTWNKDAKQTQIAITAVYNWDPRTIQQRPAVMVKRGPLKTHKMSIGDILHGAPDQDGYTAEKMMVAFTGSHTFFCCGRNGIEAEEIGAEVAYELLEFSQVIREQFNLMTFSLFEIGQVHRLHESHEHFAVPVTVAYGYSHGWTIQLQRPIWMSVGLDIHQND